MDGFVQDGKDLRTGVSAPTDLAALAQPGVLGVREDIEAELDGIAEAMRGFYAKPADMVLREVAAYSARLTEMTVLLVREERIDPRLLKVRTQQVERYLTELDRQYRIASRLIETQRQDLALMGRLT